MDQKERALQAHRDWKGKIEVISRCKVENAGGEMHVSHKPHFALIIDLPKEENP